MPDIRVTIDPKTHGQLKSKAALVGTTLRQFVIDALTKLANSGGK